MIIYPDTFEDAPETAELPDIEDYAVDWEQKKLAVKDGKNYKVAGLEALKIWIYKALKTELGRYTAYSDEFGSELGTLIGQVFTEETQAIIEQHVIEALRVSPYIRTVYGFGYEQDGDKVKIFFMVDSAYGEFTQDWEVDM